MEANRRKTMDNPGNFMQKSQEIEEFIEDSDDEIKEQLESLVKEITIQEKKIHDSLKASNIFRGLLACLMAFIAVVLVMELVKAKERTEINDYKTLTNVFGGWHNDGKFRDMQEFQNDIFDL